MVPVSEETASTKVAGKMKVFVSYSRDDVAFADQLILALEDRGYEPILDRHDIDAAENWKARLGGLILSCDAVVFVLTATSAASTICGWEVAEAASLGKRIVPIVPRELSIAAPPLLADLNWIHFYATQAIPGSGIFDGMRKLDRALRVDLAWLREQTRLSERAAEWTASGADDRLLRGAALKDAQDWLGRAPKDAKVPTSVRDYLSASADVEHGREAAAHAQLKEREQAVRDREEAVKARVKADVRLRSVSLASLVAGLALLALSVTGIWYAGVKTVEAGARRAELFAQASQTLVQEGDWTAAAMMAVAGTATGNDAWFENLFVPGGHVQIAAALARAQSSDRRIQQFELAEAAGCKEVYVNVFATIPDSSRYVVFWECYVEGSAPFHASVFEVGRDKPVATFDMPDDVNEVSMFADGDRVLIRWNHARAASIWSLSAGKDLQILVSDEDWYMRARGLPERKDILPEARDEPAAIALDEKGGRALVAHLDGNVRAWTIGDPEAKPMVYVPNKESWVQQIAFDPKNAEGFAASDDEGFAYYWRFAEPDKPFASVNLSPPASEKRQPALWIIDWIGGELNVVDAMGDFFPLGYRPDDGLYKGASWSNGMRPFSSGNKSIQSFIPSPNGDYVLVTDAEGTDPPRLNKLGLFDTGELSFMGADAGFFERYGFLSKATALVGVSDTGRITIWSFPEGFEERQPLDEWDEQGNTTFYNDVYGFGGNAVVSIDRFNKLARRWKDGKSEPIPWFSELSDRSGVWWLTVSPNGEYLASSTEQKEVGLWRIGETEPIMRFPDDGNRLEIGFHADGDRLLTANSKELTAWRIGESKPLGKIERADIGTFAFAPDGLHVAISAPGDDKSYDEDVEIWRLGSSEPKVKWELGKRVEAIAFTPDGQSVVISRAEDLAGEASELLTYSLSDGHIDVYRTEGRSEIHMVHFSPDGRFMMGASSDATLVWRIGYAHPVQVIETEGVSARFDFDGQHLLTTAKGGIFRRELHPSLLGSQKDNMKAACARAEALGFTGFSPELRQRFPIIQDIPGGNPCKKLAAAPSAAPD